MPKIFACRSTAFRPPAVRRIAVLVCAALLVGLGSCVRSKAAPSTNFVKPPVTEGNRLIGEVRVGAGIACYVNGSIGPPSYNARDLGKAHVPVLSSPELKMLRRIMIYVHPTTLRFAHVAGEFIVFDALDGPCSGSNYFVLNGDCNEFYSPTDDFSGTRAGTGCWNPPRPWIQNDRGSGTWSWSNYPNNH